jgi:pilus assembly protein Flp/PilA
MIRHQIHLPGGTMTKLTTNLFLHVRDLVEREEGQDLVEYALVVALIAFGAIAGMQFLAGGINTAFSDIAATVTSNIT